MSVKNEKRILIVEDSLDIQTLLARFLESEGYTVARAANGNIALNLLQSVETLPNLILLDLMMPDMDGFQFRDEQKKNPRLAKIPVVVMTASGDIQSKAMKIGAKGF